MQMDAVERGPSLSVMGDDWGQGLRAFGRFAARHRSAIEEAGGLYFEPYHEGDPGAFGLSGTRPVVGRPEGPEGIVAVPALSYYRDFSDLHPQHPKVAYSIWQSALCHQRRVLDPGRDQAATRDALVFLDRLLLRLVLSVGLQHQVADAVLRGRLADRPQQREAAAFAVDGVLARREGDVAAVPGAPLPDGKADQLQAVEQALGEMQLGVRQLSRRVPLVVRRDLDHHNVPPCG